MASGLSLSRRTHLRGIPSVPWSFERRTLVTTQSRALYIFTSLVELLYNGDPKLKLARKLGWARKLESAEKVRATRFQNHVPTRENSEFHS